MAQLMRKLFTGRAPEHALGTMLARTDKWANDHRKPLERQAAQRNSTKHPPDTMPATTTWRPHAAPNLVPERNVFLHEERAPLGGSSKPHKSQPESTIARLLTLADADLVVEHDICLPLSCFALRTTFTRPRNDGVDPDMPRWWTCPKGVFRLGVPLHTLVHGPGKAAIAPMRDTPIIQANEATPILPCKRSHVVPPAANTVFGAGPEHPNTKHNCSTCSHYGAPDPSWEPRRHKPPDVRKCTRIGVCSHPHLCARGMAVGDCNGGRLAVCLDSWHNARTKTPTPSDLLRHPALQRGPIVNCHGRSNGNAPWHVSPHNEGNRAPNRPTRKLRHAAVDLPARKSAVLVEANATLAEAVPSRQLLIGGLGAMPPNPGCHK